MTGTAPESRLEGLKAGQTRLGASRIQGHLTVKPKEGSRCKWLLEDKAAVEVYKLARCL